jgi:hypothetical protein
MELKNVVKFFIFLIVIVFDPLAVALIIAFNGLIGVKKKSREELLSEMAQNNQKMGLYEVYGDTEVKEWKEYFDNLEKNQQNIDNSENIIQSEEDSKLFFDTIENPPAPVDALIEAKEKYEEDLKKKSMKI